MKFFIKYKYLSLSCVFLLMLATSCNDDDNVGAINVELAEASYHEVLFTRISDTEVRDELYIRIGVTFENAKGYSNLGIYKMLLDGSGQEVSRAVALENIEPNVYTRLTIENGQDLFNGLSISQHEIQPGHSFKFVTFGSNSGGDPELFSDSYEFIPEYNVLEFDVSYNGASTGHVDYTRTSDTNVSADVNIDLTFTIGSETADIAEYTNIGLMKHLYDANGVEIDAAVALENISANSETRLSITDLVTLFEGLDFDYNNNLDEAYTFSFTAYAETVEMETVVMNDVFETTASFQVRILPQLETGTTWIVTNTNTGFSKEVELRVLDSGEYYFTDFGIDWSWWNDFWYGSSFSLGFSDTEGDPFVVELGGYSGDTGEFYDQLADDGVTIENRPLRLMGYTYQDGSPKGTFDEDTQTITFTNVNILDWWWAVDSHNNVSMTFVKQ